MTEATYIAFDQNEEQERILLEWWRSLEDHPGDRAELRRCESPTDVVFQQAYHRLYHALTDVAPVDEEKLAVVAGLAAHVDDHVPDEPLGRQLGTSQQGDRPVLSHLRFRRILQTDDYDDFYTGMMRAIKLVDGRVNLLDLATKTYWWSHDNERSKKDLAFDYYDAAPEPQGATQGA